MWSKTFKPGDGKAKRDVAMSAQASLILKKKAEIEAKMAADGKGVQERKERKPISLSINKRWGLKGKKDGSGSSSSSKSSTAATSTVTSTSTSVVGDNNHWNKYTTPSQSQANTHHAHTPAFITTADSGPGLPPPPTTQLTQPQHVSHQPHQVSFSDQLQHPNLPYPPVSYETNRPPLHNTHHQISTFSHAQVPVAASQQPLTYLTQPPPAQPPPAAAAQSLSYDLSRPPPMMQPTPTHFTPQQPTHLQPQIQYDASAPPPQFIHNAQQNSTANIPPQMLQSPNHPLQPNFPPNLVSHPISIMSQAPPVSSNQHNSQNSQMASSSMQAPQIIPQMHPGPQYSSILTQPHPSTPYPPAHPEPQMVAPITTINFAPPCSTQPVLYTQPPHPIQQAPPIASQPPPILSQPPPISNHPPPIGPSFTHHPPTHIPAHPPPILTHPPPGSAPVTHPSHSLPNITLPPPIDPFQGPPPSQPPLHHFGPPPSATNVTVPPPSTFPDISLPPPNTTFPPPIGSQQLPNGPPPGSGPTWWKDALAKAKDIASVIGKPPPVIGPDTAPSSVPPPGYQTEARQVDQGGHHALGSRENDLQERYGRRRSDDRGEMRPTLDRRNSFEGGNGGWLSNSRRDSRDKDIRRRRESNDFDIRDKHDRRRSRSRDRVRERSPHLLDRGRERSPRRRSRSRGNSKDSDRSHYRERHFSGSSSLSAATVKEERDSPGPSQSQSIKRERKFREEKEPVKTEPRDIDLRKPKLEREYSPSKPDYQPTVQVKIEAGDPLPSVVEELASMVAVSGEDLEDIARDRNKNTPELKFLFEKSGPLYRRYRARVAELKESFDDSQSKKNKTEIAAKVEPAKKRKSRWGTQEPAEALPNIACPPSSVGAPGVAIPTALGGLVQKLVSPTTNLLDIRTGNPGLSAYAQKVFGTTDLSENQWKQCEDQLKMSVVYGNLAAKQAMANAMSAAGKIKYDYDSDEETEGGTWEHRARMLEMAKTEQEASKLTDEAEGKHHIGDFLPPEELNKFMSKYKAMQSGTPWDNSEYQENRLTQDNVGFKMLQKMGWAEGAGLGAGGQGVVNPIGKSGAGLERQGLGTVKPGEIGEGDDEFDQYRKRMMLAYRFRPNPMNNPRRQYY